MLNCAVRAFIQAFIQLAVLVTMHAYLLKASMFHFTLSGAQLIAIWYRNEVWMTSLVASTISSATIIFET